MFSSLEEIAQNNAITQLVKRIICAHLKGIEKQFEKYFQESKYWRCDRTWIQFPFTENATHGSSLSSIEEDQLIELSSDSIHKNSYQTKTLTQFWTGCQVEFPDLTSKAMKCLLPFATTYLCESAFSSLTYLKNRYRSRLQPENDLRLSLSAISQRTDQLCDSHQGQVSH